MNEHNAELWQSFLTIVLNFMIGAAIAFCILVVAYVIGFIALRIGQVFKKDVPTSKENQAAKWAKENPLPEPPMHLGCHKEHGLVKLSDADHMVLSGMDSLARTRYIIEKINIFRGSDTKIELLINPIDPMRVGRVHWREV